MTADRHSSLSSCRECKNAPEPGFVVCATCREQRRLRRLRYEAKRRERTGRTAEARREREQAGREVRLTKLRDFAASQDRVPTLAQVADLLGVRVAKGNFYQDLRREAFGIRVLDKHESRAVIPYPVPDEWRATA